MITLCGTLAYVCVCVCDVKHGRVVSRRVAAVRPSSTTDRVDGEHDGGRRHHARPSGLARSRDSARVGLGVIEASAERATEKIYRHNDASASRQRRSAMAGLLAASLAHSPAHTADRLMATQRSAGRKFD